jgi:2-polyprenyl-3-methyl-5-hydroxy-6-metoxy-1,4-benzoquinol methylase
MDQSNSIPCKVCRASADHVGFTYNLRSGTARLHAYRCTECGLVFVGTPVTADELGEAYSKLDADAYYEEIAATNARKFAAALSDLEKIISKDSRVLDVGTGDGAFVRILLNAGYHDVAAHEVPGTNLTELEARGCRTYLDFDYSSIPSDSFDVVTLMDVAEHVIDPAYLFQSCNRILKAGGIVYCHTPAVTRTDRMMHYFQKVPVLEKIGRAWQTSRTSIYHLQNYTREALSKVLTDAGFQVDYIRLENELSWPVAAYVRVYLCNRYGVPQFMAPVLAPFVWPFVATNLLNPNKAVVCARKP